MNLNSHEKNHHPPINEKLFFFWYTEKQRKYININCYVNTYTIFFFKNIIFITMRYHYFKHCVICIFLLICHLTSLNGSSNVTSNNLHITDISNWIDHPWISHIINVMDHVLNTLCNPAHAKYIPNTESIFGAEQIRAKRW